jgi:hypothetical protein
VFAANDHLTLNHYQFTMKEKSTRKYQFVHLAIRRFITQLGSSKANERQNSCLAEKTGE